MDYKSFNRNILEYLKSLFWFFITIKYSLVYVGFLLYLIFFPVFYIIENVVLPIILNMLVKHNVIKIYYWQSSYELAKIDCSTCFATFLGLYYLAKIFGIFDRLKKLNFYLALLLIIIISLFLFLMAYLPIKFVMIFFILFICYFIFDFYKSILNKNTLEKFDFIKIVVYRLLIFICCILSGVLLFQDNGTIFYNACIEYSYTMYFLIPAFMLHKLFGYMTKKFPFPLEKIGYYTSIEFFKSLYKKIMNKIKSKLVGQALPDKK